MQESEQTRIVDAMLDSDASGKGAGRWNAPGVAPGHLWLAASVCVPLAAMLLGGLFAAISGL